MLVEIVVPAALGPDLADLQSEDAQFERVDDPRMRFGVVEVLALLAVVKGTEEVIERGIRIWKLLRSSGEDTLSSTIRSPHSDSEVVITPEDSEAELRARIRDAFNDEES
jgi:hypothetical protein